MKTTMSWGLVLSALLAVGCSNGNGPTLARPKTAALNSPHRDALGATNLQASAQFDAPVIDVNSTAPAPTGSGTFTVAPNLSGGSAALGVIDASGSPTFQYVMVGDLTGSPSNFFAVIADVPFTVGTHTIDNVHWFAGVFDAASGEPTHLASSGSVTFTVAGAVGGRFIGSFAGALDEVAQAPSCRSSLDCAAGESCLNGTCVVAPPQCTSNAQCAAGQQCVSGQCVTSTPACVADRDCAAGQQCSGGQCIAAPPACVVDADCAAGQQCANGQCVVAPPACVVDADCAAGEQCLRGACVVIAPPQCTSNAQCAAGQQCVGGQCVTSQPVCVVDADCGPSARCQAGQCVGGSVGVCEGQFGDGQFAGSVTSVASCAALPSGSVSLSAAHAAIDDQRRVIIFDGNAADEAAVLELSVCPGATGTLTIGNGLSAASYVKDVNTATVRLFSERKASSATLNITRVSPSLAGTFSLTLSAGGQVSGSFSMH